MPIPIPGKYLEREVASERWNKEFQGLLALSS